MLSYSIDTTPLLKILLHAAKYPAAAINGLLLGSACKGGEGGSSLQIVDAVPLFHGHLHLSMPLETVLLQVDAWARSRSLQVVGLYHANDRLTDRELGSAPRKIADKLQQQCSPRACALLVDNERLGKFLRGTDPDFLQLHVRPEGARGWSAAAAAPDSGAQLKHAAGNVPQLYLDLVARGQHRQLSDFDDHLDDLARDWKNPDLVT